MTDYKIKENSNVPHLMLEIWESRIPTNSPLGLTPKRKATLKLLFTHVFGSSLARWGAFVDSIAISEHLTLKAVKACESGKSDEFLNWVIKPETCLTILEGVYTEAVAGAGGDTSDEIQEESAGTKETQLGEGHE